MRGWAYSQSNSCKEWLVVLVNESDGERAKCRLDYQRRFRASETVGKLKKGSRTTIIQKKGVTQPMGTVRSLTRGIEAISSTEKIFREVRNYPDCNSDEM